MGGAVPPPIRLHGVVLSWGAQGQLYLTLPYLTLLEDNSTNKN